LVPNSFFCIIDRAPFEYYKDKKGRISLLSPVEAQKRCSNQRPHRPAKSPAIKGLLQRGVALQYELDSRSGLTRSALARELHLDPSRVTQILNLLNLTPSIQDYICNLPATKHRSPIRDEDWMRLARLRDQRQQIQKFEALLEQWAIKNKNVTCNKPYRIDPST